MADDTESVLRLMTPKQAIIWRMVLDGVPQFEIADRLQISECAVSRLISRGRRRVKKYNNILKKCKDYSQKRLRNG